ncbi:MAG: ABC transporter substrate-binding protein, partial [Thermoproteota archaeon]
MKKANVLLLALFMAVLVTVPIVVLPVKAEPRSDLQVHFYGSDSAAWSALVAGDIDFLQWALTEEQKEAAEDDPNIQLARVDENGKFEFDINNNYTIKTYPGIRSITNELKVRQAIACLVDKQYIIREILHYYGVRIDQPIAAPQTSGWCNESVIYPNYPYEYNPERAAQLLMEAGFIDEDGDGWVEYPADWDGLQGLPPGQRGTDDYPLVLCVRSDHGHRLAAGYYILEQLENTLKATSLRAGIKTTGTQWFQPRAVLSPKVMGDRDYHIYTGGWSLGRFPTYLFFLFHSMFWYPYGSNYVTGVDKEGNPNYPDVDEAVAGIWYAKSIDEAVASCKKFCGLHAEHCITIELWSYSSYWAYRKNLVGVVNMNGYGIENAYTFLNAYRVDGGPIRMGCISGPSRLNILYSQWYFEYAFLDRIYTGLLSVQPYNLAIDQPWVAQDWEIGTWLDGETEKTKVTYYLRKDVGIVAPETGCVYPRPFNASDLEFTIWYNYAFTDSWQYGSFMDVKFTEIKDVNGDGWSELIVYFDDMSIWFYASPTGPLLAPKEV